MHLKHYWRLSQWLKPELWPVFWLGRGGGGNGGRLGRHRPAQPLGSGYGCGTKLEMKLAVTLHRLQ